MTFPLNTMTSKVISTLLCASSLVACGGGGGTTANTDSVQAGLVISKGSTSTTGILTPVPAPVTPTTPTTPAAPETPTIPVATPAGTLAVITDVRFQNTSAVAQTSVPVTFGQVFAVGDVKTSDILLGRMEDNSLVTLQMDVKARHADGSVRHAIFSAIIPTLAANATRTMSLAKNAAPTTSAAILPAQLLAAGFTASTSATISGVKYTASADQLLKAGAKATWLAGAVANEWHVSAPLTTSSGVAHPHLTARFAIRYYSSIKKARVDVTIENNWAYEPNPQNFKYNADVTVGGTSVYSKTDLNHLTQARWRKVFWWGGDAPQVNPMLNTSYLLATRALPNYDQTVVVPASVLESYKTGFTGAATEPMGVGVATAYMPTTGGRSDIGILPGWAAIYALTMDDRARKVTLGTADLAGSWSSHYRDKKTDRPVSLMNYPFMTILGRSGDTYNPVTKQLEAFPSCGGICTTPYTHDSSHQPGFAYLPYLVTGDYYYLEELQFWAMWNLLAQNPGYRQDIKGLIIPEQTRGQAWGIRTLSEAAYITPDADLMKADFVKLLDNNLEWYNANYSNNPDANTFGAIVNGYAISYGNTGLAPWQDDFFTAAIGHTAELGFAKAKTLLAWKSKFPIGRMTAPGACWIDGSAYVLMVRDTESSPFYKTMAEVYKASHTAEFNALACNSPAMASNLGLKVGEMTGYSDGNMGYPSNMQPALAYAADATGAAGKAAWTLFMSRTVKPNYGDAPEFAIVPR